VGIFKRAEKQTPETLLFLADAEDQAARVARRDGQQPKAAAAETRAAGFRRRADKARKAAK